MLPLLHVELLAQLEIQVVAFLETDVSNIHWTRCRGTQQFRNQERRNNSVWVQAGREEMYDALRGRLLAKLLALFKITDCSQDTLQRLAAVQMLSSVNSSRPCDIHSLLTVQLTQDAREFTLVDIGTILGLAHIIPEGARRWHVNSHIDWRMFNQIYYLYKRGYDRYVRRRVSGAMATCIYSVY